MATFPDLSNFVADTTDDGLTLPIRGRDYTFHSSLPFGRALQVQKIRAEASRLFDARLKGEENPAPSPDFLTAMADYDETETYLDLIGDEMRAKLIADEVPWEDVLHVGATLLAWHMNGEAVALRVWTRGKLEDADNRPPAEAPGSQSTARTTSRSGSTKKTSRKPAARTTRGATTSTAGR